MSARSVVEMAAMAPAAAARRYYHGTKTQAAADRILADGVLREPGDTDAAKGGARGSFMRPVAGVYLTPEIAYAAIYALGGDYAGSAPPPSAAEPFGYLFAVDGAAISDAEPDEDVLGSLIYQIGVGDDGLGLAPSIGSEFDKYTGHPELLRALRADPALVRRVQHWFRNGTTRGVLSRAAGGSYTWAVKAGKQLLRAMPEDLRAKLVELGSHVSARQREVPWAEAWRIRKADAPRLARDGSNFFGVAERVAPLAEALEFKPSRNYAEYGPAYQDVTVPGVPQDEANFLTVRRLPGRRLEVTNLGIPAPEQGKGHGRAAVQALEAWAREQGIRSIHLESAEGAVGFWEKMGFARTGTRASESDWTRMAKAL